MRELFPLYEAYNSGFLDVGDGHEIYFEESGNPNGIPVVYIHGGPGDHSKPSHRQYFNPSKYRFIAFDQRGCGKSKSIDYLKENTTWKTIEDMEKLRKFLKIETWLINGRSWGSLLALVYAINNPEVVKGIITGGIYLATRQDIAFLYDFGANLLFPDEYEKFTKYFEIDNNSALSAADNMESILRKLKDKIYL